MALTKTGPKLPRIIPLGTNGFIPTYSRHTMSFLLLGEGAAVLIDAGTGVGRLLEPGLAALLQPYDHLNVILSHYHLDHLVGLTYLTAVCRDQPITLYAPTRPLVDSTPDEAVLRLLQPPLFPVTLPNYPAPVTLIPYSGDSLEIGGFSLRLRRQRHTGGSVGMRFGDRLAYCTDSALDAQTEPFVRGVGLLLHECWLTDEEGGGAEAGKGGHSGTSDVARLARTAHVGRVMPVHHHPKRTAQDLARIAAQMQTIAGCPALVAEEGQPYDLP